MDDDGINEAVRKVGRQSVLDNLEELPSMLNSSGCGKRTVNILKTIIEDDESAVRTALTTDDEAKLASVIAKLKDDTGLGDSLDDVIMSLRSALDDKGGIDPATVKAVSKEAFEYEFKFTEEDGRICITGYRPCVPRCVCIPGYVDLGGRIAVVESIEDAAFVEEAFESVVICDGVKTIGECAFGLCHSLESVEIPDSVTAIGKDCFSGDENLGRVRLPESLSTIDVRVFSECKSLKQLAIPDSVTTIRPWAFGHCDNLTSIRLPSSVTRIDGNAFRWCKNLILSIDEGNPSYVVKDNIVYSKDMKRLVMCMDIASKNAITVPEGVTSIDGFAFSYLDDLQSVKLPDSLESIGEGAFAKCPSLKELSIPANVREVHDDAFKDSGLESITLHSDLDLSKTGYKNQIVKQSAAPSASQTDATSRDQEPGNEETAPGEPTDDDRISKNYEFILSVLKGFAAEGKQKSDLDEGTRSLIRCMCVDINELDVDMMTERQFASVFEYTKDAGSITITGLKNAGAEEVTVPPSVLVRDKGYKVVSIGKEAFAKCRKMKTIHLPDSINEIGKAAFSSCSALESICIPKNVEAIEDQVFFSCVGLKAVEIPEGVTTIGYSAFYFCKSLEELSLPSTMRSVDSTAFRNAGLKRIVLHSDVDLGADFKGEVVREKAGTGKGGYGAFLDSLVSDYVNSSDGPGAKKETISFVDDNGNRYEGEGINGVPNGKGVCFYKNGSRYEGDFEDGWMSGTGIFTFSSGARYEGGMRRSKWNGKGIWIMEDGSRYEGDFVDGKMSGRGIFIFEGGNRYEGEFKDDKFAGEGKLMENGNCYEGTFEDSRPNGTGRYSWSCGDWYEGQFARGKYDGQGAYHYKNGDVAEGTWSESKLKEGTLTTKEGVYRGSGDLLTMKKMLKTKSISLPPIQKPRMIP